MEDIYMNFDQASVPILYSELVSYFLIVIHGAILVLLVVFYCVTLEELESSTWSGRTTRNSTIHRQMRGMLYYYRHRQSHG